jgi:hypothetical protein
MSRSRAAYFLFIAAAYGSFAAGLVWKTSLEPKRTAGPPPERWSLPRAEPFAVDARWRGDTPVFLGIEIAGDDDLLAADAWLREKRDLHLALELADASGALLERTTLQDFAIASDLSPEALVIGRTRLDVPATAARLRACLSGTDSFLLEHRPFLQLGRAQAALPGAWTRRVLSGHGAKPGLLVLAGGTLVFLHLFFVLARLCVPWRKNPPPPDDMPA